MFDILKTDGVPKRFRRAMPMADVTEATENVAIWRKTGGWCLMLSGPTGVGKSFAAAKWLWDHAVARRRRPHPMASRRWYPAVLLARLSQFDEEIEELNTRATLVIDDLGVEYADKTGNFRSRLDYLLDARYSEERPTIITTNLSPDHVSSRYGVRIVDRIRDGGGFCSIRSGSRRGR